MQANNTNEQCVQVIKNCIKKLHDQEIVNWSTLESSIYYILCEEQFEDLETGSIVFGLIVLSALSQEVFKVYSTGDLRNQITSDIFERLLNNKVFISCIWNQKRRYLMLQEIQHISTLVDVEAAHKYFDAYA